MTKIFFDTEFTGLHQKTTLISIGIISECGKTFYCELVDYDESQCNDWINENVIKNLYLKDIIGETNVPLYHEQIKGGRLHNFEYLGRNIDIKRLLIVWLSQFETVEVWSDCLAYDWVLFNNIFGTAFDIPKNVYYIPFDICTLFKMKDIDPDISREEFAFGNEVPKNVSKHNALWDARVIKECFYKLDKM